MRALPPIEMVVHAALALGDDLCKEVVFLGGAVVGLLLSEPGVQPDRPTKDVDVAIEIGGSIVELYELDRRLLSRGFRNDPDGPTCRYLHGSAVLDVIPVTQGSEDDVNSWYPHALSTASKRTLPNGVQINLITPVCFLGTKFVAFRSSNREHSNDLFLSRDFEDIIRIVDGRPTIAAEVASASKDLRAYLQSQFVELLKLAYIEDAVASLVESGRETIALDRIRDCSV